MSIELNMRVAFRSADEGQDDIVYSVVKDKMLELRAALLMLSMTQKITMNPPTITMTRRGDSLTTRVDLEKERHSEEP